MPGVKALIDANTFLYSQDVRFPVKRETARNWLRMLTGKDAGCTNLQVLNECTHVMLRKKWFASPREAYAAVDVFRRLGSAALSWAEVEHARRIHEAARYSWWDCLLLASTLELGCTHFLSEDLQDGQRLEGLTILSPFAHSPRDILS